MTVKPSYFGSLSLLTSLFFIWGFVTCLNDILIPHLKSLFVLNYAQVMLVQFCFFAAYLIVSVPSGYFVERFGYRAGIVTGLCTAGAGCLLFYPAAELLLFSLFLVALFVMASGIALLQVAANPYVTLLGPPETASSRLTLTQAFNSLGTTVAPAVGGWLILSLPVKTTEEIGALDGEAMAAYQLAQAHLVQPPYLWLAGILFAVALLFARIRLPSPSLLGQDQAAAQAATDRTSAWHYPHLVLGALAIFVYVGAEVAIGSFMINFLGDPAIGVVAAQTASRYVSLYWGGAMIGRFIGAWLMRIVPARSLLTLHALIAGLLVTLAINGQGQVAMGSLLAVGLFNSIMFPTIFSLAVSGLGPHAGQGSGILCAAIVGGAVIPVLQGLLADRIGLQPAFIIPVLCYGYIVFYGWFGSRLL